MTPVEIATQLYRPEDDGSPIIQFSPSKPDFQDEREIIVTIEASGFIRLRTTDHEKQQSYSVLLTPPEFQQICQWFLYKQDALDQQAHSDIT